MYHVIKIGELYLTADGSLSMSQADALRIVGIDPTIYTRKVKITSRHRGGDMGGDMGHDA